MYIKKTTQYKKSFLFLKREKYFLSSCVISDEIIELARWALYIRRGVLIFYSLPLKDICQRPTFIASGASRFDVEQGELGDPWWVLFIIFSSTRSNKPPDCIIAKCSSKIAIFLFSFLNTKMLYSIKKRNLI